MSENKKGKIVIDEEYMRKIDEQRKAEAWAKFNRTAVELAETYFELPEEERQALKHDAKAGYSMAEKEARHVARMKAREAGAGAKPSASQKTGATARQGTTASAGARTDTAAKTGASFNFCPTCGYKLDGGFKFCPKCGRRLS